MRLLASTLLLMLISITVFISCEQGAQMMKPAVTEQAVEDTRDPSTRERATEIVVSLNQRLQELSGIFNEGFATGELSTDFFQKEYEKIIMEEAGLEIGTLHQLSAIHRRENPTNFSKALENEVELRDGSSLAISMSDLTTHYLELTFLHPEKNTDELLVLFLEIVKEGETTVVVAEAAARLGIEKETLYF